jgi:deazaflavin-dependent oxidoreductase (nitroreductase family)
VRDGDHVVLIASRGGDVRHPAWFHNLKKEPRVRVIGPRITGDWRARVAAGDERERLWHLAAEYYPGYDTYRVRAGGREIPVVVHAPRGLPSDGPLSGRSGRTSAGGRPASRTAPTSASSRCAWELGPGGLPRIE